MPRTLSPRQLECATLFAHGLQAQEIGRRLDIQTRTVETHLEEAYRRLEVSGRAGLRRALGIDYGRPSSPMPESAAAPLDRGVGGAPEASKAVGKRRTPYELYAALGPWRVPPRPPGGRMTVVMAVVVVMCMALGTVLLILSAVYAVLNSAGFWQ